MLRDAFIRVHVHADRGALAGAFGGADGCTKSTADHTAVAAAVAATDGHADPGADVVAVRRAVADTVDRSPHLFSAYSAPICAAHIAYSKAESNPDSVAKHGRPVAATHHV